MRNCNCNDSSTKAHKACPFRPILPAPSNGRDDSYICIMSTFQANQQQAHQIRLFQGARCTFFLQIVSLIHTVVIIVWNRMPEYKRFQFLFLYHYGNHDPRQRNISCWRANTSSAILPKRVCFSDRPAPSCTSNFLFGNGLRNTWRWFNMKICAKKSGNLPFAVSKTGKTW